MQGQAEEIGRRRSWHRPMPDEPTAIRRGADQGAADAAQVPHLGSQLAALREQLTWADRLLLCLDFDGTLAPIVADPADATLRPGSRRALGDLTDRPAVTVAVVSGRELADVRDRVGVEGLHYAGNHGLEMLADGERTVHPDAAAARPELADALERLRASLADIPGIQLEDKGLTATVHYRRSPSDRIPEVRAAVEDAVTDRPALEATEGKQIVELRPAIPADKGTAVEGLLADYDGHLPIYVGDDETDEAAFRALDPLGVGVQVGDGRETAADYRLADTSEVVSLLRWLATEGADELGSPD